MIQYLPLARFIIVLTLLLCACQAAPTPTQVPASPTSVPTAAPTVSSTSELFHATGPAMYRVMENGRLAHIADAATLTAFGYDSMPVSQVANRDLEKYTLDAPLTRWLTGRTDTNVYFIKNNLRYRVPNLDILRATGGNALNIVQMPDAFLGAIKLADTPLNIEPSPLPVRPTAAMWANGFLWIANDAGKLLRWNVQTAQATEVKLPGARIIHALTSDGATMYAGDNAGNVWRFTTDGNTTQVVNAQTGWVAAFAVTNKQLVYADATHYDLNTAQYRTGQGVIQIPSNGSAQNLTHDKNLSATDSLANISALSFSPNDNALWAGTRFGGVWRFKDNAWQNFTAFNSDLGDNTIYDVKVGVDGAVWVGADYGVSRFQNGVWQNDDLADDLRDRGESARSIAVTSYNTTWVAGAGYLARRDANQTWQVFEPFDYPMLADVFDFVALDNTEYPWFIGHERIVHYDGQSWQAYDLQMRSLGKFAAGVALPGVTAPPLDFPFPTANYTTWLKTFPRPQNDNGRGIHFSTPWWFDEFDFRIQIQRLKKLGIRWILYPYVSREQLIHAAPIFKSEQMMVIWRPIVKPYQTYDYWKEDVQYLRRIGMPPYIQVFNEPSLDQEWAGSQPDLQVFLTKFIPAVHEVYNAGGYVGIQSVDADWLRPTLRKMKAEGMSGMFNRVFYVSDPYGANHPPDYTQDEIGVLGFRFDAQVLREELGFVPMMVAGEGGWRLGEAQDNRYPAVSEALHRDYTVAIFDWFRTGRLSNGEPLPDYFFAFCPWLLSDQNDPAAWYDSKSGDRVLTIEAVSKMSAFQRKFSWDK